MLHLKIITHTVPSDLWTLWLVLTKYNPGVILWQGQVYISIAKYLERCYNSKRYTKTIQLVSWNRNIWFSLKSDKMHSWSLHARLQYVGKDKRTTTFSMSKMFHKQIHFFINEQTKTFVCLFVYFKGQDKYLSNMIFNTFLLNESCVSCTIFSFNRIRKTYFTMILSPVKLNILQYKKFYWIVHVVRTGQ